ncbi:hypothetical protein J6590_033467 [Homalodisca vitripennis]|nr:hypothetical protein J6590_033467 [Homalodisca vitripennis]
MCILTTLNDNFYKDSIFQHPLASRTSARPETVKFAIKEVLEFKTLKKHLGHLKLKIKKCNISLSVSADYSLQVSGCTIDSGSGAMLVVRDLKIIHSESPECNDATERVVVGPARSPPGTRRPKINKEVTEGSGAPTFDVSQQTSRALLVRPRDAAPSVMCALLCLSPHFHRGPASASRGGRGAVIWGEGRVRFDHCYRNAHGHCCKGRFDHYYNAHGHCCKVRFDHYYNAHRKSNVYGISLLRNSPGPCVVDGGGGGYRRPCVRPCQLYDPCLKLPGPALPCWSDRRGVPGDCAVCGTQHRQQLTGKCQTPNDDYCRELI